MFFLIIVPELKHFSEGIFIELRSKFWPEKSVNGKNVPTQY